MLTNLLRKAAPSTLALFAITAASLTGCAADLESDLESEDEIGIDDSESELRREDLPKALEHVALGRLFQHEDWVIPAADVGSEGKTPVELRHARVAYACESFKKLDPTYVSGLVRLDGDEPILPHVVKTYKGVRSCLREATNHPVRFDVVLNTRHYTSGKALVARLAAIHKAFSPDIVFFDFFDEPMTDAGEPGTRRALAEGIDWAHEHKMLVGGNVSSRKKSSALPPGTDFVAIKYGNQGFGGVQEILDVLPNRMPVLLHIQNDPQIADSAGLRWIDGTREHRRKLLDGQAARQDKLGYTMMYPVFFPLKQIKEKGEPTITFAYDAKADGLLPRMAKLARTK